MSDSESVTIRGVYLQCPICQEPVTARPLGGVSVDSVEGRVTITPHAAGCERGSA